MVLLHSLEGGVALRVGWLWWEKRFGNFDRGYNVTTTKPIETRAEHTFMAGLHKIVGTNVHTP
jgi:hypothetical protein